MARSIFLFQCILGLLFARTRAGAVQCFDSAQVCFQAAPSSTANAVDILMATKISTGWIAIGFGPGMANVDMIMLFRATANGPWTVSRRLSTGYSRPAAAPTQNVELRNSTQTAGADGYYQMLLRRPVAQSSTSQADKAITNDAMQMAVASYQGAGASATAFSIHSQAQEFVYSGALDKATPLAFGTSLSNVGSTAPSAGNGNSARGTAILMHGIFMALSWSVLSFSSVLIARFMKARYAKQWFPAHRALFLLVLLLTLIGFVLAVATNPGSSFGSVHGIIGLTVFISCLCQVGLGIYIDKAFDPQRSGIPFHDKLHWGLGYVITVLAPINVVLGHLSYGTGTALLILNVVVMGVFVAFFVWGQLKIGQVHETESSHTKPVVDHDE